MDTDVTTDKKKQFSLDSDEEDEEVEEENYNVLDEDKIEGLSRVCLLFISNFQFNFCKRDIVLDRMFF